MSCLHDTRSDVQTVATAGFAGLLLAILKSGAIRSALQGIIQSALTL